MSTLTGEKPFQCEICEAKLSQKGPVKNMPIHTGEKPFRCEFCGAKFSLNSNLKKHFSMRTGKKAFH